MQRGWAVAAMVAAALSGAARAQDASDAAVPVAPAAPGQRQSYEASFFAPFAPANALEIVGRVPGFTLESGDSSVRGFGGAAGNVVINGARPSAKSDSLETILQRIPASRVARVEIGPGNLFGAEFAGRAQVVNVVLSAGGGLAGNFTGTVRRNFVGRVTPDASASALLRRGRSAFNASLGVEYFRPSERGSDRLFDARSGATVETRLKFNDTRIAVPSASLSWEHKDGPVRAARLNGRLSRERFELDQDNRVFPAVGRDRDDRLSQDSRELNWEVGGDVTRPFMGGGLKLIGLATHEDDEGRDTSFNRVDGEVLGGFEQAAELISDERVLRLIWSRGDFGGWNVEAGAEGAFNRLRSDVQLFSVGAGGVRTRIDLPVDQATVQEYRSEVFVNAGRALTPELRLDGGLTLEASRLTVRGDTRAERALKFLKPKLTADWRPGDGWHAQLALARTVAQLNFGDFISAAELSSDRVNGGNAELLPQRAYEAELTIDRPVFGKGVARVELGYNRIELLQDRVPIEGGLDAPGNIGTGTQYYVRPSVDLPLGTLGIKGGRVQWDVLLQRTSVVDPYTGERRRFSGALSWDNNIRFTQDLGRYAWGLSYFSQPDRITYRRNELDTGNSGERLVFAYAEYRPEPTRAVTLGVDNLLNNPFRRFRTFFFPDRSDRQADLFERRERFQPRTVYLRFKQSFG